VEAVSANPGVWVHPDGRVTVDEGVRLRLDGEAVGPDLRIAEGRAYEFHAVMHGPDSTFGEPIMMRFTVLPKEPMRIIMFKGEIQRVGKTNGGAYVEGATFPGAKFEIDPAELAAEEADIRARSRRGRTGYVMTSRRVNVPW